MSKIRIDVTEVPYHVFSRGNNKGLIFFDDYDRLLFLKYWREAKKFFDFQIFTYALMDNHFHFLIQMLKDSSLAQLMHHILFKYARYINRKHNRVGHLFQGRYHSIPVESDSYIQTVDRYIHLNAPRAGLVAKPEDYRWSSYRDRFNYFKDDFVDHDHVLNYFQLPRDRQLESYRQFTEDALIKPQEWTLDQLSKITYLGSPKFYQQIFLREKNKQTISELLARAKETT